MELDIGIKHIIDGDAVIIMGAGASFGAKNAFGDFPSGALLASELYQKCGITPDDPYDLQDATQCYEEQFSASSLIWEIRSLLNCSSFTQSHEIIYSLPWMRYYTTNYDDVALLAARKCGVIITPVTIKAKLKENIDRLCVHINGHLSRLNESTIRDEFKLTASSYLSQNNILNSNWGNLLSNDLETAKCIFIVGLSLKYDLDLSRILFNPDFIDKTVIIDSPKLSENAENKLSRFGTVYKIGIDDFAKTITDISATYLSPPKFDSDRLYTSFIHEYKREYNFNEPTPEDVFHLFLNGEYRDSVYYKTNGRYGALVYRKTFSSIKQAILDDKQVVFIHSDMGNGKTACVNELRYSLSNENIHIFTLDNADSSKISVEITAISNLAKTNKVLVFIEEYTSYMDIIGKFSLFNEGQIQFVLTARTALNYNKMPKVLSIFSVQENCSAVFDLNTIDDVGIENCIKIFNRYGLFGRQAKLMEKEKKEHLTNRKYGARKFQSIMLDVIQSDLIKTKVEDLIQVLKTSSAQYHDAIIIILLTKMMSLRLSVLDIERILDLTLSTDALFRTNPGIMELIAFGSGGNITLKSSVTARFILQRVSNPETVILALKKLALYAEKYYTLSKFSQILTTVISYSHIHSFLRGFSNSNAVILSYYDELSKLDFYQNSNFFWLQYAIACIEIGRFDRAERYLETAYGLIPDGFDPFQINNQKARFYLERIINRQSPTPTDDFCEAHKLLMLPISSVNDNEYNIVQLFGYYCRKQLQILMNGEDNQAMYKLACKDAYHRVATFTKEHPIYEKDLKDLKVKLMQAYVN